MARLRAGQKLALAWFFGNRESRKFIGGGGGATLEIKQSIQPHPLAQGPEPVNSQNEVRFFVLPCEKLVFLSKTIFS